MVSTPAEASGQATAAARWRLGPLRLRSWLILLVAVCLGPFILFSGLLLVRDAAVEARQVEQLVSERALLLAQDIDREVARIMAAAEVLGTAEMLQSGDLASFYRRAAQVHDLLGTNVVLRDPAGQQVVNTRVPWGTDLPLRPLTRADRLALETGRPQVSDLILGGLAQVPLLIVVVPVPVEGAGRYLLSLTIELERLAAILDDARLSPGWLAMVADQEGRIIGRSQRAEALIGTPVPAPLWQRYTAAAAGTFRADNIDGVPSRLAFRHTAAGWVVVTLVPEQILAAPARRTLLLFLGGGLLLFLTALGAATALARGLARPILELAGAAQALGRGEPVQVPHPGVVELAAAGQALAATAAQIAARETALRASERRLRQVVAAAPFPIIVHRAGGAILHASQEFLDAAGAAARPENTLAAWVDQAVGAAEDSEPRDRAGLLAPSELVDAGELPVRRADGSQRVWHIRSAPLDAVPDEAGAPLVVTMAADVTAQKETEVRLRLLMREVDHRAKNALAVVQSILQLSRGDIPAAVIDALQGRIDALARVHSLLAQAHWSGADLASLVQDELAPVAGPAQIVVSGPQVLIAPEAAQAVSIVVHELATNAIKYGALSVPTGRVSVSWAVGPGTGAPAGIGPPEAGLHLHWQESGGPVSGPPTRRGFGSFVIEQTVTGQLGGTLKADWTATGLHWFMELPAGCLAPSSGAGPQPHMQPLPPPHSPARALATARTPRAGALVLVVEDEALTALALAETLQALGYRVLGPVGRVAAALALVETTRPDAAVLDINLFGEMSYPVAAALQARGVPYLFCTGYESHVKRDGQTGHAPLLRKPVSPRRLAEALAALLSPTQRPPLAPTQT